MTNEEAIRIIKENHCNKHCCEFCKVDCLKSDCALWHAVKALELVDYALTIGSIYNDDFELNDYQKGWNDCENSYTLAMTLKDYELCDGRRQQ